MERKKKAFCLFYCFRLVVIEITGTQTWGQSSWQPSRSVYQNDLETETDASSGKGADQMQAPPLHADESGNYVDEVADTTASITALSFYCTCAL